MHKITTSSSDQGLYLFDCDSRTDLVSLKNLTTYLIIGLSPL